MSYIWPRNYLFPFDQNQRNIIKRNNCFLFIFNMLITSHNGKKTKPLTELPAHVSGFMLIITNSPKNNYFTFHKIIFEMMPIKELK